MTTDTQAQAPVAEFGRARPRKEDARLVTGQTNWTDNTTWLACCTSASCAARTRTPGSPAST